MKFKQRDSLLCHKLTINTVYYEISRVKQISNSIKCFTTLRLPYNFRLFSLKRRSSTKQMFAGLTEGTHFMEGRCRRTTSTAWTGFVLTGLSRSIGAGAPRPVKTSCSMCQLTNDTNLIVTLNGRSFPPSPGRVTSRSTWGRTTKGSHLSTLQSEGIYHFSIFWILKSLNTSVGQLLPSGVWEGLSSI